METCYVDSTVYGIVDLIHPGELLDGAWVISRINVPTRYCGMGHGGELLKRVCTQADEEQIILALQINPYGPMDYDDLEAWYIRYGFYYEARTGYFLRMPGAPIRPVREGFPV
jgi:hypothetical protein